MGGRQLAQSRYRGLRATLTAAPDGSSCFVTVAIKKPTGRWDEYHLICPAIRLDIDAATTLTDAAAALSDGLYLALREAGYHDD